MTMVAAPPGPEPSTAIDDDDRTVVGDSATTAGWTLVSRATGFARVLLIGAILGPTFFGNLFQLANTFPWVLFEFAVGGLLGALLVPALMRHVVDGDLATVGRIAGRFMTLVVCAFGALAVVVAAASPLIARLFALGIDDATTRDQFVAAAIPLIVITAPQLVGYGIAVSGQAVQHAMGRYALPAAASIVENVVVIATLVTYAFVFGPSPDLADIDATHIALLGGGSTLGVAAHAVLQLWGVRRLGIRLRFGPGWRDPDVRAILTQVVPSVGTAVFNGARILALLVAANTVAGGVVAVQFGLNVLNLPVALAAKPVAYSLLPRLAAPRALADRWLFADTYRRGVGLAALLLVPAAAGLMALGWIGGPALALGEMGTDDGRRLLSLVLVGIAGAVIGEGMFQLSTVAAYARRDVIGPTIAMAVRATLTAIGVAVATLVFDDLAVVACLVVAMSLADLAGAALLHRRVTDADQPGDYRLARSLRATVVSAVVAFAAVGAAAWFVGGLIDAASLLPHLLAAAVLGVVGLAIYLFLRWRSDGELFEVIDQFRSGGGPRAAAADARDSGGVSSIGPVGPQPQRPAVVAVAVDPTVPRLDIEPRRERSVIDWAVAQLDFFVAAPAPRRLTLGIWGGVFAALAAGAMVALVPPAMGVAAVGILVVSVVVWNHPPAAGYAMIAFAPFIVGFGRDQVLPLLRPNEALLFVLCGVLGLRWLAYSRRISIRLNRMDWVMLAIVFTGMFLPLTIQVARARPVGPDDIFYALVFVRLALLYGLVRHTIRTPGQVRTAIALSLATGSVMGVMGLADSLNLANAAEYLNPYFPNDNVLVDDGRGAATIGNPIGFGVYSAMNALLAIAMLLGGERPRLLIAGAALCCTAGVVGSGQIGPVLSFAVGIVALAIITRSTTRLLLWSMPALLVLSILAMPLAQRRISGFDGFAVRSVDREAIANTDNELQGEALFEINPGSSWDVRLYNLEMFFIPEFDDVTNVLWGVSPQARVSSPREGEEWIWIESGHLWLLWTGGIPLTIAWFTLGGVGLATARRRMLTEPGPVGIVAAATFAAIVTINVAQIPDPHMTLRGSADIFYPMLALMMTGWTGALATSPRLAAHANDHGPSPSAPPPDMGLPARPVTSTHSRTTPTTTTLGSTPDRPSIDTHASTSVASSTNRADQP
ncbi:MAG: murein biosynthesis integral membrane protein MurJ [Acidimicrobiales bacterium]